PTSTGSYPALPDRERAPQGAVRPVLPRSAGRPSREFRTAAVTCSGSEPDALGAEELDRVDGGAVVRGGADLDGEVGSAGVAGVAGQGDLLAGLDDLADLDVHLREVRVLGVGLVAVLDDDGVAVGGAVAAAVGAGLDDGAAVGGDDRGAAGDGVVLAAVLG